MSEMSSMIEYVSELVVYFSKVRENKHANVGSLSKLLYTGKLLQEPTGKSW